MGFTAERVAERWKRDAARTRTRGRSTASSKAAQRDGGGRFDDQIVPDRRWSA